jgi:pantoate--beta-alanine ligase
VRILHSISEVRSALGPDEEVGLVPTMGALHAGHGALLDRARRENQILVVSLFVNPIQFDRAGDFQTYPRDVGVDAAFCQSHGADFLFAPSAAVMYPEPQRVFVEPGPVAEHLCGHFRPGHFRGVATVVIKLLHIVQPRRVYFGEKDAQQLAVIRSVVADLNVRVEVIEVPTLREPDGLAMSSRNRLLSDAERAIAPQLYRALRESAHLVESRETSAARVRSAGEAVLAQCPEFRVEYFEVVDPVHMQPVLEIAGPVRIAVAAYLGSTRLIDNVLAKPRP